MCSNYTAAPTAGRHQDPLETISHTLIGNFHDPCLLLPYVFLILLLSSSKDFQHSKRALDLKRCKCANISAGCIPR